MSNPRLTFLYPMLFRPAKAAAEPVFLRPRPRRPRISAPISSSARRRQQEVRPQRYGIGNEPPIPILTGGAMNPLVTAETTKPARPKPAEISTEGQGRKREERVVPSRADTAAETRTSEERAASPQTTAKDSATSQSTQLSTPLETEPMTALQDAQSDPQTPPAPPRQDAAPEPSLSKPPDTIMHIQPSSTATASSSGQEQEEHKMPDLKPRPYVHHFDTYTLVRSLGDGGFAEDQAVTVMKAVRLQLADNMELAKEALVSKSDTENQAYLFRAACSELRTEIQNSRKASMEKMRSERTHLQHEVDILNQRVTQETLNLKDELKGMFDDRKMAVRMEQRQAQSYVQTVNNKITIELSSNARSEVEGLRLVLARRAVTAILTMAVMILGTLRYSAYMEHKQEAERERLRAMTGSGGSGGGGRGGEQLRGLGGISGTGTGTGTGGVGRDDSIAALGTGEVVLG